MRLLFLNIFLFLFFLPSAYCQLAESVMKSHFVVNMVKFIEWENEESIDRYKIGVLGRNEIAEEFRNRARTTPIKGKGFDVIQFRRINDITGVHILYVDKKNGVAVRKIIDQAIDEQMLIISDSCMYRDATMINLLDLKMPGNQFEINKDNMDKANIGVSTRLLYYGGSQEDLREMYSTSERELSNVQEDLEAQTALLSDLRKDLDSKKKEILVLSNEINSQKQLLESMTSEIEAKQDSLDLKTAMLGQQELQIEEQELEIEQQELDIEEQIAHLADLETEIEEGKAFLDQQLQEIENQEEKIASQQSEIQKQSNTLKSQSGELEEQSLTIEKQQTLLYYFIAFAALLAATIFFVLRSYQIKRKANKILEEKNAAISKQKKEIESQQEQLKIVNQKIEKQNENIRSSIHYALTIQQALLPAKEQMDKFFESYVIYRPRDIVSGDFYWMSETIPENGSSKKSICCSCGLHWPRCSGRVPFNDRHQTPE